MTFHINYLLSFSENSLAAAGGVRGSCSLLRSLFPLLLTESELFPLLALVLVVWVRISFLLLKVAKISQKYTVNTLEDGVAGYPQCWGGFLVMMTLVLSSHYGHFQSASSRDTEVTSGSDSCLRRASEELLRSPFSVDLTGISDCSPVTPKTSAGFLS